MTFASETVAPAAQLVNELVRVFKVRRLYAAGHPQRIEIEASATARVRALLDEAGSIELEIVEDALLHEEEVVYHHDPGPESLAFLLFREGLRQIAFYPGLEAEEAAALLDHVAGTSMAPDTESDLVARLWEEKLVHIRYLFVERFADQEWLPPAAARVGEETRREQSLVRLVAEDRTELEEPPVLQEAEATLYFLDDEDLAALQAELEEEKDRTLINEYLTCMRELLLAPVHEDPAPILDALAEIQASFIGQGAFEAVRAMHVLFEPCLEADDRLRQAFHEMRRAALDRAVLARLAVQLDGGAAREAETAAYYRMFGGDDLGALLSGVPDLKQLCQLPVFGETFAQLAAENLPALRAAVAAEEPDLASAAAYLAGLLADSSLIEPLGAALDAQESRVRLEALLALKHFDDERAVEYIARKVDDQDPAIRLYALRHLIACRYAPALPQVATLLRHPSQGERALTERRLLFEAYGSLGGASVVDELASRLRRHWWFFQRADSEERACALIGLAATRTESARAYVKKAADSRDPLVQRVARQALTLWEERAASPT
jgi:hypothetical protein